MMDRFLRLASIVLIVAGAAACEDDTEAPVGETSTVNVSVFVEDGASDDPIAGATVTLDPVEDGENLTATTGADGVASFTGVPAGVYTATHSPATPITNATLTGPAERTVVAQFEGGTTTEAFIYSYDPGAISGVFFRDENDNDAYDAVEDTTLAGFTATLFAGDTNGTEIESITVGDDGAFLFEDLAQGAYTILVLPIAGAEVADSTVEVTVNAGETTVSNIEFTGGEAIIDIAAARDLPIGTAVTITGVITAGTDVISSSSAYVQDATGGIVIDLFDADTAGNTVPVLTQGDSVLVSGVIGEFSSELRVRGTELTVEFLGSTDVPEPTVITGSDLNAGTNAGELVQMVAVTLDSIAASSGSFSFNENVYAHDATGDFIVRIDGTTGIDESYISFGSTYNITGVAGQFGSTAQLLPRSSEDLVLTSTPAGTQPISVARLLQDDATTTVEGVVVAGTGTYNSSTIYIQDNTAGILVFHGSSGAPSYAVGDSIRVAGTLDTFSGERELANVTITVLGTGTVPAAESISGAELNAGQMQGELVVADSVEVLSVSESSSGNVTVVVRDDSGTFTIFGDVDTGLDQTNFTVGSSYSITGIAASFNDLRQIKPRSVADVTAL